MTLGHATTETMTRVILLGQVLLWQVLTGYARQLYGDLVFGAFGRDGE
jgi:hypothetical protein